MIVDDLYPPPPRGLIGRLRAWWKYRGRKREVRAWYENLPRAADLSWLKGLKVGDADPCGPGVIVRLTPNGYVSERSSPLIGGVLGLVTETTRDFERELLGVDPFVRGKRFAEGLAISPRLLENDGVMARAAAAHALRERVARENDERDREIVEGLTNPDLLEDMREKYASYPAAYAELAAMDGEDGLEATLRGGTDPE